MCTYSSVGQRRNRHKKLGDAMKNVAERWAILHYEDGSNVYHPLPLDGSDGLTSALQAMIANNALQCTVYAQYKRQKKSMFCAKLLRPAPDADYAYAFGRGRAFVGVDSVSEKIGAPDNAQKRGVKQTLAIKDDSMESELLIAAIADGWTYAEASALVDAVSTSALKHRGKQFLAKKTAEETRAKRATLDDLRIEMQMQACWEHDDIEMDVNPDTQDNPAKKQKARTRYQAKEKAGAMFLPADYTPDRVRTPLALSFDANEAAQKEADDRVNPVVTYDIQCIRNGEYVLLQQPASRSEQEERMRDPDFHEGLKTLGLQAIRIVRS